MLDPELTASATALRAALQRRDVSVHEVARHYLDRLQQHRDLGCFLRVDPDDVLAQAQRLDAAKEKSGRLFGIPIAVKDNLCTRNLATTCASKILSEYIPDHDATCVEQLRQAGALVLGKTNLDEFAMGASTESSAYQLTHNPYDVNRVPGGSSGGSAAAVAADLAPLALGSDTGGSVRQPAAFCGIVGLRPTYGTVSRYGLIAFASSLDQVGPMAKSVADVEMLFDVLAAPDPRDSTSRPQPLPRSNDFELSSLRIGIPREYRDEAVDEAVRAAVTTSAERLQDLGASIVDVELPLTEYAIPAYYLVVTAEASSNLSRFDGIRFGPRANAQELEQVYELSRGHGFGEEVKRRILLGTFALSAGYYDAYYKKAQQVRQKIRDEFDRAFATVDVLLGPTTPTPAFPLGAKTGDPLQLYLCDVFTAPNALAGLPAISLPAGLSAAGLPIGVQCTAPALADWKLLQVAAALEAALPTMPPPSLQSGSCS